MNKTIWITGASSGIGEALATEYAQREVNLILSARSIEKLNQLKNRIQTNVNAIKVLPLDLEKPEEFNSKVKEVIAEFKQIDLLINNAGVSQRSLALETSIQVERRIMEIDFFGTIQLTKEVLPHMLDRKSGQIAIVSSLVGIISTPYRTAYAAAKHALHGYFDGLRAELYQSNIHFSIVCPGFIQTDVSVNALTETGKKLNQMDHAQANGMPPRRFAKKMIAALQSNKEEVYIGGKEVLGVYLKRFFPSLFSKILRKTKVR